MEANMLNEEWLDNMWEAAVRDDLFTVIVPSDVRVLIREIRRLQEQIQNQESKL